MWQLQETQPPDHWLLVSWLWKGTFFWLLKFSWCPWEVMTQAEFWLSSLQHLSNFLMLCSYQKPFSSFPVFFKSEPTPREWYRAVSPCIWLLVGYLAGWQCRSVFCPILSLGFHHWSSLLVPQTARGNSFLTMCNSTFTPWCSSLSWQRISTGMLSDTFSESLLLGETLRQSTTPPTHLFM